MAIFTVSVLEMRPEVFLEKMGNYLESWLSWVLSRQVLSSSTLEDILERKVYGAEVHACDPRQPGLPGKLSHHCSSLWYAGST